MAPAVIAALLGQTTISALTYLAARRATAELAPLNVAVLRLLGTGLIYALVLAATRGPLLPPRADWGNFLLLGLLAGPINQGFFVLGMSRSTAAHGALLYALTPLLVYGASVVLGRERSSPRRLLGIGVAFAGVAVLLLGRGLTAAASGLTGDLFILTAVLAWMVLTLEVKPLAARHGPVRTTAWCLSAGALWALLAAPLVAEPTALLRVSPPALGSFLFMTVCSSVIAYLLWNYALSRAEASRVAVFSNLQPVATAIAAWLILQEPIAWEVLVGGALVLLGVRRAQA
jgi:drug/metabolite transporter (DMT)-like permease